MLEGLSEEMLEAKGHPHLGPWIEALSSSDCLFVADPTKAGLDVAEKRPGESTVLRCRLKILVPEAHVGLAMAYKDSRLAHSQDRFAYGFLVARRRPFESADIASLLAYLQSEFHPDRRPSTLKRALPYDVPR